MLSLWQVRTLTRSRMTKVQVTVPLSRPLTDEDFERIARIHAVYGILAARVLPQNNQLFVEYDSSRLSRDEVRGTLAENGIPIT
jgi:hypothetical protein